VIKVAEEWLKSAADGLVNLLFLWRCDWPIILSVGLLTIGSFSLCFLLFWRNGEGYGHA